MLMFLQQWLSNCFFSPCALVELLIFYVLYFRLLRKVWLKSLRTVKNTVLANDLTTREEKNHVKNQFESRLTYTYMHILYEERMKKRERERE